MNFAAFIIVETYETSGMKRTAGFTLIVLMVYINSSYLLYGGFHIIANIQMQIARRNLLNEYLRITLIYLCEKGALGCREARQAYYI